MVVPKVLGADEVARILARAKAIAHGEHPPAAKSSVMRDIHFAKKLLPMPEDPERALWKIMNADRFDPALRQAMRSPGPARRGRRVCSATTCSRSCSC